MKYTKRKDYDGSIRKVWSNDKEVMFGIVGTVGDFLKEGVLEYCDAAEQTWCFFPSWGITTKAHFGKTREEAIGDITTAQR